MASLACQQVVELVTDYLEGSLRRRTRRRFEEHLAVCPGCQRYLDQMRETLAVLGTVPADSLSPEAQQTLLDAFRDIRR
jgi:predicted anti-sigma-YlaC factor YlaD